MLNKKTFLRRLGGMCFPDSTINTDNEKKKKERKINKQTNKQTINYVFAVS